MISHIKKTRKLVGRHNAVRLRCDHSLSLFFSQTLFTHHRVQYMAKLKKKKKKKLGIKVKKEDYLWNRLCQRFQDEGRLLSIQIPPMVLRELKLQYCGRRRKQTKCNCRFYLLCLSALNGPYKQTALLGEN